MATIKPIRTVAQRYDLTDDEKLAYDLLLADYKAATHLVGYTGGLSKKIAVALIQGGWRKQAS
jgi:hypothetical protein